MKCGNGFRWYSFASRGYYLYLPGYPGVHGTVLPIEDITCISLAILVYTVRGTVLLVEYITCISLAILVYMVQCCQ